MSTEQTTHSSNGQHPTKAELEAEIERLRHSVGDTVEALTHRMDVKARAREKVRATPPAVPIGVAVALAAGLGLWLWRRHAAGS